MSKMTQADLEAYLGKSANILYGVISPEHYKEYIIPLLFFKRISDMYDEETQKALDISGGDEEFAAFARGEQRTIKVYGTDKEVTYDPQKRVGVMFSKIGASTAISLGAYAFALNEIDKK